MAPSKTYRIRIFAGLAFDFVLLGKPVLSEVPKGLCFYCLENLGVEIKIYYT
jgi:hypothetical protein